MKIDQTKDPKEQINDIKFCWNHQKSIKLEKDRLWVFQKVSISVIKLWLKKEPKNDLKWTPRTENELL